MSALAPALAALAALIAVALLYLLKPPHRRLAIPSLLIWDRVLQKTHIGSDRLRWWLSMLLCALIAAALAIALLRSQWFSGGAESTQRLILVLDNSPTMAARTTGGASRWDQAVNKASGLLRSRTADIQVMVVDTMRRIAIPEFEAREAALVRLRSLRVAHGAAPVMPDLPALEQNETVVFTDGVLLTGVPREARVESVFEAVENAGIVAFDVRAQPADPGRPLAFVEVANAGGTPKKIELVITGFGQRSASKSLAIAAGGSGHATIDLSGFEPGPVKASLIVAGDALDDDDVAYGLLPMRSVLRVGLVSAGNRLLETSLRAQSRVKLLVRAPAQYSPDDVADVWVFDRYAPANPPAAPALLIRPGKADWLPSSGTEILQPVVQGWDAKHPLLENISLRDLVIDRAASTPAQDSVLIRARNGQTLARVQDSIPRQIWLAFALEDSNFALQAGFPIFLDNALNWLVGERATLNAGLGMIEVKLTNARVNTADGSTLDVHTVPGGSLFEIAAPGLYTAASGERRMIIAASVLDRRVTGVNVSPLAGTMTSEAEAKSASAWAVPLWLLWAAAFGMLFEWWSWNRRLSV
jgi:Aerotolerance regulator N-terminal